MCAHPALLGGVDEEQPTEAPERLTAQRLLTLLVDQEHSTPGVGDLRCGGGSRSPCPTTMTSASMADRDGPDRTRVGS